MLRKEKYLKLRTKKSSLVKSGVNKTLMRQTVFPNYAQETMGKVNNEKLKRICHFPFSPSPYFSLFQQRLALILPPN